MAVAVVMPKPGNSVEACLIVEWKKAVGEAVAVGEVVCLIETDKAVMEVESPAAGVLLGQLFEAGAEVPVMTPIAFVGEAGEEVASGGAATPLSQPRSTHSTPPPVPRANPSPAPPVSPRARLLASQNQVSLEHLLGSGPSGRIIERDVRGAIHQPKTGLELPLGNHQAIPLKGVRKLIAQRMLDSLQTTAQLSLHASADARSLIEWRKQLKTNPDPELSAITLGDLVLFGLARTLPRFPELNAWLTADTLYHFESVHLGVAVDTPRGLVVPVIPDAPTLSLRALSRQARTLAKQAREGSIQPQALQGGSFTLTNLGHLGIESFTPILNPPQVAILGVGNIQMKPVHTESGLEFWPHLGLSLTINHQATDGAPAARFLQALSQNLADFVALIALA